jgi:hypothetical protein
VTKILGTMTVQLCRDVKSADGKRVYREGEIVNLAIQAGSDCRVWQGDKAPVLATFHEIAGATIREQ